MKSSSLVLRWLSRRRAAGLGCMLGLLAAWPGLVPAQAPQAAPAQVIPAAPKPAEVPAPGQGAPSTAPAPAAGGMPVPVTPAPPVAPPPGAPPLPVPTPRPDDLDATMTLNLNNAPIDQLVKFLGETTGKPVLKAKNVSPQITVNSPAPVTRRRALELIYDALLMDNVYIVEQDNQIQILMADALKGLQLRTIGAGEDLQSQPDSFQLAQKIYKLENINADDLKNQLIKFIPETVISTDPKANTLVLTDRISRLKYYDRVISTLELATDSDRTIEIFKLEHGDAVKMAAMIGRVLLQVSGNDNRGGGGNMPPEMMAAMRQGGGGSNTVSANGVTIVPDATLNWLIVSCPKARLADVRKLVDQFDQEPTSLDIQPRLLDVHHIEVNTISQAIANLFPDNDRKADKEQIRVVSTEDGNKLIVYSSQKNFELVKNLVASLDTENAEKKESRTYKVEHLEVQDLSDQLTKLWEEQKSDQDDFDNWYWGWGGRRNQNQNKPSFVPSPRTNTLMVMARPRDFEFIEEMIKKLDVPVEEEHFDPHIYQIHHTDANELVNVLDKLFKEAKSSNDDRGYYYWRNSSDKKKGAFEQLFGEIRFVVDNVTNRIVVLASNPKDYEIVDRMIKQLDQVDPEATEVMVCELKYADPIDVADRLNSLFSEGAVQQPNLNQNQQNQKDDSSDKKDSAKEVAEAVRQIIYPWQSGSKDKKDGEGRPINTMIGNIRIVPDTRSNKILCAAPPIYFDSLKQVIQDLDQPEPQVYIKARIVEVVHGRDRRIGVRWTPDPGSIDAAELENAITGLGQIGLISTTGQGGGKTAVESKYTLPDGSERTVATTSKGGNMILGSDVNVTLLVQLLLKNSNSRVISEPAISVKNNQKSNLFFGSEVAFQEGSLTTDVGSVTENTTYQPVGISLDIQPHINNEAEVVLKAELEDSNIREGELINSQPIKDMRKFSTELVVDSGQTMVIGGIMLDDETSIDRQVPILGSIPVIKYLFSKKDRASAVRELVFFITPEVLESREQDDAVLKDAVDRLKSIDDFSNPRRPMRDFKPLDSPDRLDPPDRSGAEPIMNSDEVKGSAPEPAKTKEHKAAPKDAAPPAPKPESEGEAGPQAKKTAPAKEEKAQEKGVGDSPAGAKPKDRHTAQAEAPGSGAALTVEEGQGRLKPVDLKPVEDEQ